MKFRLESLSFSLVSVMWAGDLFVVSATVRNRAERHEAQVLRVADTLVPVAKILSASEGISLVVENQRGRRILFGSFSRPSRVAILNMDHPDRIDSLSVTEPPRIVFAGHILRDPILGLRFAALTGALEMEQKAVRIQLSEDPFLVSTSTPGRDDFKYAELAGTSGLANLGHQDIAITNFDSTAGTARMFLGEAHIAVPLPIQLQAPSDSSNLIFHVKNDEVVVVTELPRANRPSKRAAARGIWYRNSVIRKWKNIATTGEVEVRGFGRWFSFTDRMVDQGPTSRVPLSMKALAEMSERRPAPAVHTRERRATGPSIAAVFENFESDGKPWNYTGVFQIVDSAAEGPAWRLETGNENSEILLIEGRTMVYRVEDSLWQATLDLTGEVTGKHRLATDPRLLDAHWAFYSDSVGTAK